MKQHGFYRTGGPVRSATTIAIGLLLVIGIAGSERSNAGAAFFEPPLSTEEVPLPDNLDVLDSKLEDPMERVRLRRLFDRGLGQNADPSGQQCEVGRRPGGEATEDRDGAEGRRRVAQVGGLVADVVGQHHHAEVVAAFAPFDVHDRGAGADLGGTLRQLAADQP